MLPPDPKSFMPDAIEPDEIDSDSDPFDPSPDPVPVVADSPAVFPPVFQYSQDNMQAYSACARRFQLRYLVRQAWPEPVAGAIDALEAELQRGDQFHRLVERHNLGIAVAPPIEQPLASWWDAFLRYPPRDLPTDAPIRKSEALYSIPFGERRLVAKYDYLAIIPGQRIVIVDWKTGSPPADRQLLAERWQTMVYLYVAIEALSREFGGKPPPDAISLIYWFANRPAEPVVFHHSENAQTQYRIRLTQMTEAIEARVADSELVWPLTDQIERCQTCTYRVLCDRTVTPNADGSGTLDASLPDLNEVPISPGHLFFDDTAEIEL